jgi:hypothetical protein
MRVLLKRLGEIIRNYIYLAFFLLLSQGAISAYHTRRVYKEFNFDAPNEIGGVFLILYNYPPKHLEVGSTLLCYFPHTSSAFTADLTQKVRLHAKVGFFTKSLFISIK